jgi:hypothetical protein
MASLIAVPVPEPTESTGISKDETPSTMTECLNSRSQG